jgi:hypothetical protein
MYNVSLCDLYIMTNSLGVISWPARRDLDKNPFESKDGGHQYEMCYQEFRNNRMTV